MVFSYIAQFSQEQGEAVNHYMRGLAMIAKTDIFFQMQPGAVRAFYDALRTLLRHSGDWDGIELFTSAAERVLGPVFTQSTDMRRVFDLAESLPTRTDKPEVTLNDAHWAKALVDVYIVKKAEEHLQQYAKKQQAKAQSPEP